MHSFNICICKYTSLRKKQIQQGCETKCQTSEPLDRDPEDVTVILEVMKDLTMEQYCNYNLITEC